MGWVGHTAGDQALSFICRCCRPEVRLLLTCSQVQLAPPLPIRLHPTYHPVRIAPLRRSAAMRQQQADSLAVRFALSGLSASAAEAATFPLVRLGRFLYVLQLGALNSLGLSCICACVQDMIKTRLQLQVRARLGLGRGCPSCATDARMPAAPVFQMRPPWYYVGRAAGGWCSTGGAGHCCPPGAQRGPVEPLQWASAGRAPPPALYRHVIGVGVGQPAGVPLLLV